MPDIVQFAPEPRERRRRRPDLRSRRHRLLRHLQRQRHRQFRPGRFRDARRHDLPRAAHPNSGLPIARGGGAHGADRCRRSDIADRVRWWCGRCGIAAPRMFAIILATLAAQIMIERITILTLGDQPRTFPEFTLGGPLKLGPHRDQLPAVLDPRLRRPDGRAASGCSSPGPRPAARCAPARRTARPRRSSAFRWAAMLLLSFALSAALGAVAGILVTPTQVHGLQRRHALRRERVHRRHHRRVRQRRRGARGRRAARRAAGARDRRAWRRLQECGRAQRAADRPLPFPIGHLRRPLAGQEDPLIAAPLGDVHVRQVRPPRRSLNDHNDGPSLVRVFAGRLRALLRRPAAGERAIGAAAGMPEARTASSSTRSRCRRAVLERQGQIDEWVLLLPETARPRRL